MRSLSLSLSVSPSLSLHLSLSLSVSLSLSLFSDFYISLTPLSLHHLAPPCEALIPKIKMLPKKQYHCAGKRKGDHYLPQPRVPESSNIPQCTNRSEIWYTVSHSLDLL
eukprot:sb/3477397/